IRLQIRNINRLQTHEPRSLFKSGLISRIRHRQFGVLVTTSFIARQAYEEVREDRHPIIFFSGGDIVNILMINGFNSLELVEQLLKNEFAVSTGGI
ncbi:MAG: hypothetical protein WBS22_19175, partial [Methylocystis sp.]